jgi:hypothetical protein
MCREPSRAQRGSACGAFGWTAWRTSAVLETTLACLGQVVARRLIVVGAPGRGTVASTMVPWERRRELVAVGMFVLACGTSTKNGDGDGGRPGIDVGTGGTSAGAGDTGGGAGEGATSGGAGEGATSGAFGTEGGGPSNNNNGGAAGEGANGGDGATTATGGRTTTATGGRYFEPGTRLKPLVSRADDVELIEGPDHLGWFDSELDTPCWFRVVPDDVERCFPAQRVSTALYSDTTCTTLVYVHYLACDDTPPGHVIFDNRTGSACSIEAYRVGQGLPSTTELYSSATGTCERTTLPAATASIWALEPEAPEMFVEVEHTRKAWQPGLDAEIREGADGSFEVTALFDLARDEPCRPLGPNVVPSVCIPHFRSWSGGYGDAACARRLIPGADLCIAWRPTASFTLKAIPDSCPSTATFELSKLGESVETPIYADDGSGACVVANPELVQGFLEGDPIDPDSLPSVDIVEVGSGPVRARYFGAGDRPLFPDRNGASPFFVAASGEACGPYPFDDGVRRCIPESFAFVRRSQLFFADASCAGERLFRFEPGDCTADTPEPRGLVIRNDDACNPVIAETLGLAGTSTAPTVYRWIESNSKCQEDSVSIYPGSIFYIAGEPLDPNALFTEIQGAIEE